MKRKNNEIDGKHDRKVSLISKQLRFNQCIKYRLHRWCYKFNVFKILNICLLNKTSVTSISSLKHMCYKIAESKKMEHSMIHEILPSEMVEKFLKLLNYKDIYQSQLVCRRWKEIIDKGTLKKIATGKVSHLVLFSF